MPVNDHKLSNPTTTGHRVMRRTDKTVQAEVRNKMEGARLGLRNKVFDRQQMRARFHIDKEKRLAAQAMKKMSSTSGLSIEARPPRGPNDLVYEKSQYFYDKSAVRERALVRWRQDEREIERTIYPEEENLLKIPWERDPYENLTQTFNQMMRLMGHDVIDEERLVMEGKLPHEEVEEAGDKARWERIKLMRCKSAPVDPFKSLRKEEDVEGSKTQKEFDVSQWEKTTLQRYTSAITQPVNGSCNTSSGKSPATRISGKEGDTLSEGSFDEVEMVSCANGLNHKAGSKHWRGQPRVSVRPHTAGLPGKGVSRPKSSSIRKRPKSAFVKACQYVDSVAPDQDSLSQSYHETPVKSIESTSIDQTNEEGIKTNILPDNSNHSYEAKHINEVESLDHHAGDDMREPSANIPNSTEATDCMNDIPESGIPIPDPEKEVTQERESEVKGHPKQNGAHISEVSFEDDAIKVGLKEINPDQEDLPYLYKNDKAQVRKKHRPRSAVSRASSASGFFYEDEELIGMDQEMKSLYKSLPQWKRDLLMEAPPCVYSMRAPIKIGVVMSRAQRKRQLEHLVDENASDVRGLLVEEHRRLWKARMSLFMTLHKMENALGMESDLAELMAMRRKKPEVVNK